MPNDVNIQPPIYVYAWCVSHETRTFTIHSAYN